LPYDSGDRYVSVALVGTATPPLWFYERWSAIAQPLEPLVEALGVKAGVRTTQSENERQLRFGRLGWDDASAQKWTHGSPLTEGKSAAWKFMEGEAWFPHWLECRRAGANPLLFVSFANPFIFGAPQPGQFNQLLHLAMPTALFRREAAKLEPAIAAIQRELKATDCVMRITPWNLNYDSVQSTLNNHMKYRDYTKDMRLDVARTQGKWQAYEPAAIR
jgi:hypothetical protein